MKMWLMSFGMAILICVFATFCFKVLTDLGEKYPEAVHNVLLAIAGILIVTMFAIIIHSIWEDIWI